MTQIEFILLLVSCTSISTIGILTYTMMYIEKIRQIEKESYLEVLNNADEEIYKLRGKIKELIISKNASK